MPRMTIKQLGDRIRADLKQAQQNGTLPYRVGEYGQVRYEVRASQPKAGPTVTITIGGIEPLIPGYPNLASGAVSEWMSGPGVDLLAKVEHIRNAYNPTPPVYVGATKYGTVLLSATVTGTRTVVGP